MVLISTVTVCAFVTWRSFIDGNATASLYKFRSSGRHRHSHSAFYLPPAGKQHAHRFIDIKYTDGLVILFYNTYNLTKVEKKYFIVYSNHNIYIYIYIIGLFYVKTLFSVCYIFTLLSQKKVFKY